MTVKAIFIHVSSDKDVGDVLQIARAVACKVCECSKVKVLRLLPTYPFPEGYVALVENKVVQSSGGKRRKKE